MRGTKSKDAFERFRDGVRARALPLTEERWRESHKAFQDAISIDTGLPFAEARKREIGYPRAWSWMAYGVALSYMERWSGDEAKAEAIALADLSVRLDQFDYDNHWVAAFVHLLDGDLAKVEHHLCEALYLNEEDLNMSLLNEMADVLVLLGRTDDAIKLLERARRTTDWNHWSLAWCLYFKGEQDPVFYDRALEETRRTYWRPGEEEYDYDIELLIAAIHIQKSDFHQNNNQPIAAAQQKQKADAALKKFKEFRPDWTIAEERRRLPFTPGGGANWAHWENGLRKLGLK